MTQSEGIIKEFNSRLYEKRLFTRCPYCEKELAPGLMNLAKHWTECPKNPNLVKVHERNSPLIDEIKKNIKF